MSSDPKEPSASRAKPMPAAKVPGPGATAGMKVPGPGSIAKVPGPGAKVPPTSVAVTAAKLPSAASAQAAQPASTDVLERARAGDKAAFGQLVRVHQRRVYACAIHMLGDRGEAEDAVQETFVRAWKAIDRFDGRAELSTWLYRICINVSLNTLRRRKRVDAADISDPRVPEPAADPTQGQTDPRHAAQALQLYGRLARALDGLSPSLRATVVLVLLDGVPQKEAAEVLGCSEGTIAWRVHEARRRLRAVLGDHLEDASDAADEASGAAAATGRSA
jgi:RNA polymerase sigma-70 factor (ECF subfamily)